MGKRKRTKDEKQKANSGAGTDARDIQSTLRTFSNIGAGRGPETSLGAVLSNGVALHQAGRLDEAEAHYRKVLSRSPHHVDALALLGAICLQRRRFDAGLRLINHSLRINSLQPMAFNNRAYALKELGRLEDALESYDRAIALKPDYVDAYYNKGLVLNGMNRFEEAIASFNKAGALKPDFAEAYCSLGVALKGLGRLEDALASYERALALKPDYVKAHNNRGIALKELGRLEDALASYERAIALKPDFAEAYNNRGIALKELGRFEEAISSLERAVTLKPDYAAAYSNKGAVFNELKRFEDALAALDRAIALKPDYESTYNNRGMVLNGLKRFEEALTSLDRAIALKPDFADAYIARGLALKGLGRLEDAIGSFDRAIALKPDFAVAYSNRGAALTELKRYEKALADLERAITLKPDCAGAYWNKSWVKLALGDLEEGFRLYEWRWKAPDLSPKRGFSAPLWLGAESLADKTILLHSEQGLGDAMQFCRYVELVAGQGANVILEVPPPIKSLVESQSWPVRVIARGEPIPSFDFHCPLLSLPLAFKTRLDTIPAKVPYLKAAASDIERWSKRLGERKKPRAGIVWSGRPTYTNDRNRSIALEKLLPLTKSDIKLISLQKDLKPSDKTVLKNSAGIRNCGEELKDFSDTAAIVSLLDLVIAVDTSVAHLAGAMGKPVWILLPFIGTDWRWLVDREDCPWYPTARLFRQPEMDDWESVIDRVKLELDALAANS